MKITSVGKNVEKLEPCALLVGMCKGVAAMVSQKATQRISISSSNSTPWYILKTTEKIWTHADTCTPMLTEALFTIAKRWKQPKCPWMDEQINQRWHKHTMEYYSALKRKEILTHATMWMNLANTVLSEISQSQKDKYCVISLM